MMRKLLSVIAALTFFGAAAWAIQPGTTGTEKRFQQQGVRFGVLTCVNNTATATAGAATLNGGCGVITSEALTTLQGSDYTLTLTNNLVAAADIVHATLQNGTNSGGAPLVRTVAPAAGSVVIVIRNGSSTDTILNGTLKIGITVIKQSALGSD